MAGSVQARRSRGRNSAETMHCRYYTVFNLEQCEGIPNPEKLPEATPELNPIDACERVVNARANKPSIQHGGDRASYHKLQDCIRMPMIVDFDSVEEYHSTLFHELIHSTGHPTRLNRATLMDAESWGVGEQRQTRRYKISELDSWMHSRLASQSRPLLQSRRKR
jgi:antirestriction protein ArdC